MSVAVAARVVEERNSSRNLAPAARPAGLRLQFAGTTVGAVAVGVVALATLEGSPVPTELMAETR